MLDKNKTNKRIFTTLIALLLCSCASITSVKTNLDGENFRNYFAPTSVEIFNDEQKFPSQYTFIAGVEGQSCQETPEHVVADEITARTDARKNAYQLKANAIVFSSCTTISTKQCHQQVICYGKAYRINNNG